jgi:hypothetical protein
VVVSRDASGRASRVWVYDFKTGSGAAGAGAGASAANYAGQLALYRGAAAILSGAAVDSVSAELVFTRSLRTVAAAE